MRQLKKSRVEGNRERNGAQDEKRKPVCGITEQCRWGEAGGTKMRKGKMARRRVIMEMLSGAGAQPLVLSGCWCIGNGKMGNG